MVALFPAFSLSFPTVEVILEPDPQKGGSGERGRVEVYTVEGSFVAYRGF